MMTRSTLSTGLVAMSLLLTACGQDTDVNPPTDPAPAIETPAMAAPGLGSGVAGAGQMPGTGPASFVGRWTANVEWCEAPTAEGRPIEITATRFEGYENSCEIATVDQTINGYDAILRCHAEGTSRNERVNMVVAGQTLTLTYPDRGAQPVILSKCTTLGDNSTKAPALPMP